MADNNLNNNDTEITNNEPATGHDVGIGGAIGAVGGAIGGGLAGGPVGAVIGAIAGGAVSAGAVDVVDKHDHDYAQTASGATATDTETVPVATTTTAMDAGTDAMPGRATEYTGPGDFQRTHATVPTAAEDLTEEDLIGTGPRNIGTTSQTAGTGQSVELREERLDVQKQPVQTGEVTLRKEVITEQQSVDVPVTREEVVIERHAVSGAPAASGVDLDNATDEVIRVPVMEEQVAVTKTPIVTEEISLGKRQVTETQHVTETVHREEAHIENPQNVDVLQRGSTTDSDRQ